MDIASKVINMPTLTWAFKSFQLFKSPRADGIIPAELDPARDYDAEFNATFLRSTYIDYVD